jgi:4a-hydroxytetrahydrobiopterin dehydratase
MELAAKTCVPCRGGIPPLPREDAETLLAETPGWTLDDSATQIERTFRFPDFAHAFGFVQRVAALAEAEDHHPDITFGWGYCRIVLFTHKIKGLHENDFIMAAKVNEFS